MFNFRKKSTIPPFVGNFNYGFPSEAFYAAIRPAPLVKEDKPVSYHPKVEEVHHAFLTASENALVEAKRILDTTVIPDNQGKTARLAKLGFHSVSEVKDLRAATKEVEMSREKADIIMDYREKYPLHKFIFDSQIEELCKKYGLVFGDVALFKGFVPEKNLIEIEQFKAKDEDKKYYMALRETWGSAGIQRWEEINSGTYKDRTNSDIWKKDWDFREGALKICAPLKDMNMENQDLRGGWKVEQHVPDPVAIFPVRHGGIILTAWGEEASDPIVVNEGNN